MALRLSQPAPGPAQTPSTATLPARASALLAARDLAGYRALFTQAASEPDVHLRYATRVRLLEAGLAIPRGSVNDTAQAFVAIADAAVSILEDEPREPVVLNIAGVALYELGALAGARAAFEAALRLDSELPHVERNLRELARRRKARTAVVKLPPAVTAALRPLEARAKRAAIKANPVPGLTLSLCMIVRDEEAMLGRCLASIRDAVDEIVVVDTGSTDGTVAIAESFGARVLRHEWNGSFADARNVSFEAATSDWIVYLDADEALLDGQAERLRALTGRTWREAFYLVETNHTGELDDGTAVNHDALRVFRNRPEYRFEGRIHEQIAQTLPGDLPERLERTDVRVEHFGYLGVVREAKDKSTRNLELLERQAAEGVDTPFLHFNLGSERSALGQHAQALEHLRRAWEGVQADPILLGYGYVPSLTSRYAQALRVSGRTDELERHVTSALEIFPEFTDLVFERAVAAKNAGDLVKARELLERCLEMGDAPSRYSPMVGCGTYMPLSVLGDILRGAGELEEAERLLRRSLDEHPRFLGALEPLVQVMLARGTDADEVVRIIDASDVEDTPARHFLIAVPLYEAGAVEAAERELRAVLARQPHAAAPRAALAEALLSQKRYDEAADVAAAIEPESPVAPAAARAELFARLASGAGDDAVAPAIARARAAGLAGDELALFEAWQRVARGEAPPRLLPAGATGTLLAVLEALLRVQDVDPFVVALPLADALALPRRRRHEELAMMYLRRGFLESAADEWAAACEEDGPDADALAGLAAIAVARDDLADAELFALGAHELQPGHAGAARVLERLAA